MTMGTAQLFAGLGAAALLMGATTVAHAQPHTPFDGDWSVTLACPDSPAAHAMAFSFEFPAHVTGGVMHGERGTRGEPGWLQLDGPIAADGSANLIAQGVTGIRGYALYNVSKGTPYTHPVQARFTPASGSGSWTTIRTCTFAFRR